MTKQILSLIASLAITGTAFAADSSKNDAQATTTTSVTAYKELSKEEKAKLRAEKKAAFKAKKAEAMKDNSSESAKK